MTAEGRARLKNFFGTRLQRRILLDHDHQRMEEERQKAIRTKSVDPTTRALEIEQEHEREAAAEQKLQQLRVPVAKMPVCRYIVVDASGQLHIRKTASVPENIRRCLAATKLLQKVCRGWRGRQKARRVLEFNERQEVFRAQMQNLLASAELARKALADAEQSAQDKDDDFNNIPDEVSMQPHVFAQVLETHFGYLHLTITELLYLTAAFLQSDGTVSCTAFVRHILGIIDSISGERRNVGGRYVFGPFPLVADLTAAPSSRHGLVSRKHKVPRAGEESMFYAQADDTGAHAYARILRVALQDPLQKFRYTPCRTSVQIPVNFRGVRELRRSSKLPSFSPQVSWIYGHSASSDHASRMVISKRNTVVYPGGKIVVLVDNVIRPSQTSSHQVPQTNQEQWTPIQTPKPRKRKKRHLRQRHFCGHSSAVTCVALHPDGVHVVTGQGGDNPHLLVWNTRTLRVKSGSTNVAVSAGRFGFVPQSLDVSDHQSAQHVHLKFNPARRNANLREPQTDETGKSLHEHMGLVPPEDQKPFYHGNIQSANFVAGGRYVVACGSDNGHRMGIWDWQSGQLLAYHNNTFKDSASQINDIIPMVPPASRLKTKADKNRVNWLTIGANHIKYWSYDPHPAELHPSSTSKSKSASKKKSKNKSNSTSKRHGPNKSARSKGSGTKKHHYYQFFGTITATTDLSGFCNPYFDGEHDIPRRTWAAVCDESSGQYISGGSFNCVFVWAISTATTVASAGTKRQSRFKGTQATKSNYSGVLEAKAVSTPGTLPPRVLPTNQSAGVHSLIVVLHEQQESSGGQCRAQSQFKPERSRSPTAAAPPKRRADSAQTRRGPSPERGSAANDLSQHLLSSGQQRRNRAIEPFDALFAGCGNGVVVEWRRPARYGYDISLSQSMSVAEWAVAGGGWIPHSSYDLHTPLMALNTMRAPPHVPAPKPHGPRPLSAEEQAQKRAEDERKRAKARLKQKMGRLASPLPATPEVREPIENEDDDTELERIERTKRKLEAACLRAGFDRDWSRLFSDMDTDSSGGLDPAEFLVALRRFAGVPRELLSNEDVDILFDAVDTSGDGSIQEHEFAAFMNFEQREAAQALADAASAKTDGGAQDTNEQTATFKAYKERRVGYAGTSEFTITSMGVYHSSEPTGEQWFVFGCRNGDVWEAQLRTGQLRNVTYGHRKRLNNVCAVPRPATGIGPTSFSANGACFVSCSDAGHLRVWDGKQHRQLAHHLLPKPAKVVTASADGLTVAVGFGDGSFALYDLGDVCLECTTPQLHFPPDTSTSTSSAGVGDSLPSSSSVGFGTSSNRKSFSNVSQSLGDEMGEGRATSSNSTFKSVSAIAFSPNGKLLAVASNDSSIRIWASEATCVCKAHYKFKLQVSLFGHVASVTSLDWSANSGYIRSCCKTHELLYWDVQNNGSQITSGVDSLALRTKWATSTCLHGFHAMGIWEAQKLVTSASLDREVPVIALGTSVITSNQKEPLTSDKAVVSGRVSEQELLLVGTNRGAVEVFNSPCIAQDAPHFRQSGGLTGPVSSMCVMTGIHEFITVSTTDTVMLQWRLESTKKSSKRATHVTVDPGVHTPDAIKHEAPTNQVAGLKLKLENNDEASLVVPALVHDKIDRNHHANKQKQARNKRRGKKGKKGKGKARGTVKGKGKTTSKAVVAAGVPRQLVSRPLAGSKKRWLIDEFGNHYSAP